MCKQSDSLKVRVSLDTIDTTTKPTKNQITSINQRLNSATAELSIEELATMVVSPHSRTWVPAEFNGPRSNDNWKSQQVFGLDFDKGISLEEGLERLKEFGLSCTFCYSTFCTTVAEPKFRIVFILKEPISNKSHRDEVMSAYQCYSRKQIRAVETLQGCSLEACRLSFRILLTFFRNAY
jgi:hypothetical protein